MKCKTDDSKGVTDKTVYFMSNLWILSSLLVLWPTKQLCVFAQHLCAYGMKTKKIHSLFHPG